MAHADYDCCAICDTKQSYQGYSTAGTKDEICGYCTANMAEHGVILHNVEEFKKWLTETPKEDVERILTAVGFSRCFYPNEVDVIIHKRDIQIGSHYPKTLTEIALDIEDKTNDNDK